MARMPSPRRIWPRPSWSCLTSSANDRSIGTPCTTIRVRHDSHPEDAMAHSTSRDGVRIYYEEHGSGEPVLLAKSIEVTLKGGMDAMAEFAIQSNPNVAGRIKLDPSARKEIFDYYRMLTPIGYANSLRALLQMDYITDRLSEITVPTLLVCGDEDPSPGPMREIQKRIPQAKFALLAPASHFANRDQPEAFNLAVVEFLMSLG